MWQEHAELDALQQIYALTDGATAQQNWRKLLLLGETIDQQLKRKVLWIWPTALDLENFHQALDELNIRNILSIGCGSGLLEWLLVAAAVKDVRIYGLERDANWWRSKYAVRSFIPLNYIEESQLDDSFLSSCCGRSHPCALLFCYFNNREAFLEYLQVFEGNWLILIGPRPALGIHTDPNPIQPDLPDGWTLKLLLNWTEEHVVTFYRKLN